MNLPLRSKTSLSLLVLGVALFVNVAAAFDPHLPPGEVQRAVAAGKQMATPSSGYKVQNWVLFDVKDPFTIGPNQGTVEAVIVGTPFERLRYASYLAAFQGTPLKPKEAQQEAAALDNTVSFIVFAHAPGTGDQYRSFLESFHAARLNFGGANGQKLKPAQAKITGPAQDFYNVPGKAAEFRYLGNVAFKFDLGSLGRQAGMAKATFSFTDSTGRNYRFPVELGQYR